MCWQISCDISMQQSACLAADLCRTTGSSNHWEAAVAGSRKPLRGQSGGGAESLLSETATITPPQLEASGWLFVPSP